MANELKKGEGRNLPKPNNIINIPAAMGDDFFNWWCVFLRPFVNLSNKELQVVASLLKHRWELSKHIDNPSILDAMVLNDATKKKVMEDCNITQQHFYVILSNLRKAKVIYNGTINPRLIPNIREDDEGKFQLLILFKTNANK